MLAVILVTACMMLMRAVATIMMVTMILFTQLVIRA